MSKDDSGKGSKIVRQARQEQLREQSEDQLQVQPEQTISIKQEEEEEDEASLVTTDIVVRSFIKKYARIIIAIISRMTITLVKDNINKNHR